MKKSIVFFLVLIVVFIVVFIGCEMSGSYPSTPAVVEPVVPEETPTVLPEKVLFALYDGSTLRYYDGETSYNAYTANVVTAGIRKLAIDDILYYFDETGAPTATKWLPAMPSGVLAASKSLSNPVAKEIAYEDDIWTLETISAEEAYSLGALPKPYTRIYKNGEEIGTWYLNQWETNYVIQPSCGDILVKTTLGHWIDLTDESKNIDIAYPDGIMLYDQGTEEGWIADESGEYYITWEMNWFDHSVWQLANGIWYTENGYTWTAGTGVISNANAMYCWNYAETYPPQYNGYYGERPYILSAGVVEENGEEVTYWIETVSAGLYRHVPSIDRLDFITTLYVSPRERADAVPYYNTLDPQIIEGFLYYHADGSIKRYEFSTGLISTFSSDQEIIVW